MLGAAEAQDRVSRGRNAVLHLGKAKHDTSKLAGALKSFGAPVQGLDIPDQVAREIYGYDLILLRPDLHIVWRDNAAPHDAAEVARTATGY